MHHYPITMAISMQQVPHISFTIEEEFRLHDLMARRDHVEELTITKLLTTAPEMMRQMLYGFMTSFKNNVKIKMTEDTITLSNNASRELYASKSQDIFDGFNLLKKTVAYKVQYTSWPAQQALLLASGGANAHLGFRDQMKTELTDKSLEEVFAFFPEIRQLWEDDGRGLALEDYEMFTSPWAQSMDDEIFFEETMKNLGDLIKDDRKLMVAYQMLLMASQTPGVKQTNKVVCGIQGDMAQLLYRYLSSKMSLKEAAEKAYTMTGFINKLHRCGDILMNRRIKMLSEEEEDTLALTYVAGEEPPV